MKLVFLCIFSLWTQISCSILKSDRGKDDNGSPVGDKQSESPREDPEDNDNPDDRDKPGDNDKPGDKDKPVDNDKLGDQDNPGDNDNPGNTDDSDNPPGSTPPGAPPTGSDNTPSQVRVSVSLDQDSDPEKGHRKLKINVDFSLPVTDFEI